MSHGLVSDISTIVTGDWTSTRKYGTTILIGLCEQDVIFFATIILLQLGSKENYSIIVSPCFLSQGMLALWALTALYANIPKLHLKRYFYARILPCFSSNIIWYHRSLFLEDLKSTIKNEMASAGFLKDSNPAETLHWMAVLLNGQNGLGLTLWIIALILERWY